MDAQLIALARRCLDGAETGAMTFSQIVGALIEGGFESYVVDYRRATATYFLPGGESVELAAHAVAIPVAAALNAEALKAAIGEAQALVPGYTYAGFCAKAKAAGCAGYVVSFSGRRAVYFGRDGAVHTELFPE
ncbi:hypothetical protein AS593_05055 [Caulobacter vibrioides]|nr:hypothetical protein AS593_05055 [Caulobacter vibrioides]